MSLKDTVNLHGGNVIEVVLNSPQVGETSEQQYARIRNRITEVMEPLMKSYLEKLDLTKATAEFSTIEQLEKLEIDYWPLYAKEKLADTIDEFNEMTDAQKIYILSMFLGAYYNSSVGYCTAILQKRAQEIANKKRIVLP